MERKKKCGLPLSLSTALAGFSLLCSPQSVFGQEAWPLTLRAQMQRTVDVSYRISHVARHQCPIKGSALGFSIDFIEAYEEKDRGAIKAILRMSDYPQIAAVAKGSPAERAGLKPGDELLAYDGVDVLQAVPILQDKALLADELERRLVSGSPSGPINLSVRRDSELLQIRMEPEVGCGARVVIKTGLGITAFSDGTNIAVSSKLIEFAKNDDELALILAHEMGHVINQDGDASGLQQRRAMEDGADAVGVALVKCAGYDVEKALQFWVRRDAQDWLRLLRSPTHRSRGDRVRLMRIAAASAICPAPLPHGG